MLDPVPSPALASHDVPLQPCSPAQIHILTSNTRVLYLNFVLRTCIRTHSMIGGSLTIFGVAYEVPNSGSR